MSQREPAEEVKFFTPILANAKASEVWTDTLASIRVNYFKEPPESHAILSSTLGKLSKKILSDAYMNNMSTGGMSANTYSAAIHKVVMPEIRAIKDEFFDQKEKKEPWEVYEISILRLKTDCRWGIQAPSFLIW